MSSFKETAYFSAIRETGPFDNPQEIREFAQINLQFQYGSVDYPNYNDYYSSRGWIGRKIYAIPHAFVSGLAFTISPLLLGASVLTGNFDKLDAYRFIFIRNARETAGQILTLFNDQWGSFHVEEENFHKTCYEYWLERDKSSRYRSSLYYGQWVNPKIGTISLIYLANTQTRDREKIQEQYGLTIIFENLSYNLNLFLEEQDPEILKRLTLLDVAIPLEHSKLKYALLSDLEFGELTACSLGTINEEQAAFIRQRLALKKFALPRRSTSKVTLSSLATMTAEDVAMCIETLPNESFRFLRKYQIKQINISTLEINQRESLLRYRFTQLTKDQIQQIPLTLLPKAALAEMFPVGMEFISMKDLFAHLDAIEVCKSIEEGALNTPEQLNLLSDKQLSKLRISNLSSNILEKMFPEISRRKSDNQRFSNFNSFEVQRALENGTLSTPYLLQLLSHDQLKQITLSTLSAETITMMFPSVTDETRQRFSYIQDSEVLASLYTGNLSQTQIFLFSSAQIRQINFAKISDDVMEAIFPRSDEEAIHQQCLSQRNLNDCRWLSGYTEKDLKELSVAQDNKNRELFNKLSFLQQEALSCREQQFQSPLDLFQLEFLLRSGYL